MHGKKTQGETNGFATKSVKVFSPSPSHTRELPRQREPRYLTCFGAGKIFSFTKNAQFSGGRLPPLQHILRFFRRGGYYPPEHVCHPERSGAESNPPPPGKNGPRLPYIIYRKRCEIRVQKGLLWCPYDVDTRYRNPCAIWTNQRGNYWLICELRRAWP